MNKRMGLGILSLLIIQMAIAQGVIKGKVIDSLSTKPVEYAIIGIYKNDDPKPLTGKLTDTTGVFVLDGLQEGVYSLKIDLLGYRTKWIKDIALNKDQTLSIGNVTVQPLTELLQAVEITGEKDPSQNKIDKQVYRADQFQAARGGTAIDVLKNMPSVTITAENEIRLRGSTGFLVLVNGKPVVADVATVLNQIPANAIENIEIITAPSSKYDADGKSGIINITTKKGTDDGVTFTVNGQVGLPSLYDYSNLEKPQRYGLDGTLNYKKDKWDISVGGSYQQNDIAGWREGDVNTTIDGVFSSFPSVGERSFKRRNTAARASVTYTLDKNNSFSAGLYYGQRYQFRRADLDYNSSKTLVSSGQTINQFTFFNSNLVKKQGDFSLANLDYTHTFANKSNLTVSALYEYSVLDGYTKNLNTKINNRNDSLEYTYNPAFSPIQGFRGKADYAINIGKGKLESGYQFRYQYQTGTFQYLSANIGTSTYTLNPFFSANIGITNRIQGLYSQYSGKWGNLEYVGGLRYEYAERVFNSDRLSTPFTLNLSNFFPSLNLLYSFKSNWKIKGGFSRRVQRSNSNELNPYPEREHSETMEQGDPKILPEFVNLTELGLIREFNSGSAFVTLYNQQIENVVNRVNNAFNDTIINRIYTNAGLASLWGLEAGVNVKPVKWWSIYVGGNLYDYRINGSLFNNSVSVNNGGFVYSFNTNHNFQLTKTWSVQFNLNYLGERPTAQGRDSRFFSPNVSVKKTFFQGKLSAVLQWQNLGFGFIKSNEQRITTWGSNFYTTTNYIQEKDVIWINLSYNFKQTNKKLKLPTSEFGEKEF